MGSAEARLDLILRLLDQASGPARATFGTIRVEVASTAKTTDGLRGSVLSLWAAFELGERALRTAGAIGGSFLEAASSIEQAQIKYKYLLGSVQEGNRLVATLNEYAAKTPFEFQELVEAATPLAGVMKGGVDEIQKWLPMIGDLAAVTGLSIQETTGQFIRMYSAGAGAADMFRERGILAMMGFKAGATYTAEETRKKMWEAWDKAGSQFKGATEGLAGSWQGLTSMLADKWFLARDRVMEAGLFEELKKQTKEWDSELGKLLEPGGTLDKVAQKMGAIAKWLGEHDRTFNAEEKEWGLKGDLGLYSGRYQAAKSEEAAWLKDWPKLARMDPQWAAERLGEIRARASQAQQDYWRTRGQLTEHYGNVGAQVPKDAWQLKAEGAPGPSKAGGAEAGDPKVLDDALKEVGFWSAAYVQKKITEARKTAENAIKAGAKPGEAYAWLADALQEIRVKEAEFRLGGKEGLEAERTRIQEAARSMEDFGTSYSDVTAQLDKDKEKGAAALAWLQEDQWSWAGDAMKDLGDRNADLLEVERLEVEKLGKAYEFAAEQKREMMGGLLAGLGDREDDWRAGEKPVLSTSEAAGQMGGYSTTWAEEQKKNIRDVVEAFAEGSNGRVEAERWAQERLKEVELAGLEARFQAADNYYDALGARLEEWALRNQDVVQQLADVTVGIMDSAVRGVSQMVGQAIVYQKDLGKMGAELLKSMAAQVISTLIETALQYVVSSLIMSKAAGVEMATKVAASAAETYAAAFASTVGELGPFAGAYAAGMVEEMLAGSAASYAAALATFGAMGAVGQAHEGLENVPRTGTYILERGERVVKRAENERLSRMIDEWEERRSSRAPAAPAPAPAAGLLKPLILQLNGRELAEALIDLSRSGLLPVEMAA